MAKKTSIYLSKSKFMAGLSCPKLLWYQYNRKKEIPPFSAETLEIMKQGTEVGEVAHQLFPLGLKVERDWQPAITHERSLQAALKRKPLFEAGFVNGQTYAIADILVPVGEKSWQLIEVKSSTSVKHEHYQDVAFQKSVYEGAGLEICQCYVLYLNRDYERVGRLEVDKLFKKDEITAEVLELQPDVEKQTQKMLEIIAGPEPEVKIGQRCKNCSLYEKCWSFIPEENIFLIRGNKKIAMDLMRQGVLEFKNIPKSFELNPEQTIQVGAHQNNEPYVNKEELNKFLDKLDYPLYFLDFETIGSAVPLYDYTRPYEDIPVQFSLHVEKSPKAKLKHYSYLAKGDRDPRPEILKELKELLGCSGSIIAYYADYEKKCLRHAVRNCPEYNHWFVKLKQRFVDLLVPFKAMWYYHPKQKGSASLKDVLPALTDLSYENMEIGAG
ncbi:MAG: DUF2779 domain-containing protein, partial [Candidatus Margulisbacteria bacterium]|nr:DUF2779 domain-containing protein [Candidatus Margulisiibacteriota bacterium]